MRALAVLALLVLAGCATAPEEPAPSAPVEAPVDAAAPSYACPAGGLPSEGGLCLASFATGANEAPNLAQAAIHPQHPDTWALLGWNVLPPPDASEAERQLARPGGDRVRSFLYVTEDAGRSWTLRYLPVLPLWSSATSQVVRESSTIATSLAWDGDGTMHVAGSVDNEVEEGLCECPGQGITTERRAFHVATTDLGVGWGPVTDFGLFHGSLEVRQAVAGDRLVVAFGSDDGAQVHVSADQGTTWTAVADHPVCPAEPTLGGATDTRLTAIGGLVYFRCRGQGASFYYVLDTLAEALALVKLEGPDEADGEGERTPCSIVLLRAWRGRPALVGGGCPGVVLWLQDANGSWQAPVELVAAEAQDGFVARSIGLQGADIQGDVVHLLLDIADDGPDAASLLPQGRRTLTHMAVAVDGTRLLEAGVDRAYFVTDPRPGDLADANVYDPFALQDGNGLLVIPGGNGFSYTLIEAAAAG